MRPSRSPRAAQETPKDLQNAMQKSDKKKLKNACRGKKCLKPAISFFINSGTNFSTQICTFLKACFAHCFFPVFRKRLTSYWNPFWNQSGPRGPRRAQKIHQELQKIKNLHFQKPSKTHLFFQGFWQQRPLKKASRGPRWLPKGTHKIQDPKK